MFRGLKHEINAFIHYSSVGEMSHLFPTSMSTPLIHLDTLQQLTTSSLAEVLL